MKRLFLIAILLTLGCGYKYPVCMQVCAYKAAADAASYRYKTGLPTVIAIGPVFSDGVYLGSHAQAAILPPGEPTLDTLVPLVRWGNSKLGPGKWDYGFKPESWCCPYEYGAAIYGAGGKRYMRRVVKTTLERR